MPPACGHCGNPAPRLWAAAHSKAAFEFFEREVSILDAIYARQSVEKADSLSIQGQIDLCLAKAGPQYKIYRDRGYSGKNTNRPAFQKLMGDVEQGLVEKIIVYRLDRLSRSISDFSRLWESLERHHVEFVSINESFDTATPIGRAMLNIVMTFAQLERETTAERVRDNYYQRAKLGSWPGGPAPYGFSIGRLPGPDGRLCPGLVPNAQAPVVQRIFSAYAQPGTSLGRVARLLNEEQIPGPKRPVWDTTALSRMLHSPLYVMADEEVFLYFLAKGVQSDTPKQQYDGRHAAMLVGKRDRSAGKYQDIREQHLSLANHTGLVEASLWLQCQYKLDANRQLGRSGCGKHTWLSGLLKCGCCGYSVKVNRDGDKYYLICSGRSNLKVCSAQIRMDLRALERSVAAELDVFLSQCPGLNESDETADAAQELALIDQKIDRLISAIAAGSELTVSHINRAITSLEGQRASLLARQCRSRRHFHTAAGHLNFSVLHLEEKKQIISQFVQEIRLTDDKADVIWKI